MKETPKSKMKEVVKLLDLELNEPFRIKYYDVERLPIYVFTDHDFRLKTPKGDYKVDIEVLTNLLNGIYEVVKIPFYPKKGETYYTYGAEWNVIEAEWHNNAFDYINLKLNLIFKTKEEAQEALPKVYKSLTGGEWEK